MKRLHFGFTAIFTILFSSVVYASDSEKSTQLPSLWGMLFGHEGFLGHYIDIVYALIVSIIFSILATKVYRNRKLIPGKLQNFLELCVEGMFNFITTILGNDAKKYTPFLGTLFFYILVNNLMGLIPGGHSATANIHVTASLAIMVFLYTQYTGLTRLGAKAYLDHLAGQPRNIAGWVMMPLLFIIEIITVASRPVTLAVRLWGNTMGGDILVAAFVGLGILMTSALHFPIGLPVHVPFILLEILVGTIQALVFTLLSTIYILLMLPHAEGH